MADRSAEILDGIKRASGPPSLMEPAKALIKTALNPLDVGNYVDLLFEGLNEFNRRKVTRAFADLCCEIRTELESREERASSDALTREILGSEQGMKLAADASRRVCHSTSHTLGPAIIVRLTAELMIAGREANEAEERMFYAAEILADQELRWFANCFRTSQSPFPDFQLRLFEVANLCLQHNLVLVHSFTTPTAPLAVSKLVSAGMASIHPEPGVTGQPVKSHVLVPKVMERFAKLIDRATGPSVR